MRRTFWSRLGLSSEALLLMIRIMSNFQPGDKVEAKKPYGTRKSQILDLRGEYVGQGRIIKGKYYPGKGKSAVLRKVKVGGLVEVRGKIKKVK